MEECKEAILELSSRKETFFGPYEMPLLNVQFEEVEDMEEEEEDADQTRIQTDDTDEKYEFHDNEKEKNIVEVESQTDTAEKENENGHVHLLPSEDSRQKLRKLEPLPLLLEKFDLDDHVGLIQKILKEDPNLVNMQATFSGKSLIDNNNIIQHLLVFQYALTKLLCISYQEVVLGRKPFGETIFFIALSHDTKWELFFCN